MERKSITNKKEEILVPKFIAINGDRGLIYGFGQTKAEALTDFDNKVNNLFAGTAQDAERGRKVADKVEVNELKLGK